MSSGRIPRTSLHQDYSKSPAKRSSKKQLKIPSITSIPQEEDLISQYYSRAPLQNYQESEIGMLHHTPSAFSPDLGSLSRMKKIVLELREQLTQLTGRMSLQGEKRFTYHQKLLLLENEIDKLSKSKEGNIPSLPVVLLDDQNSLLKKDRQIIQLQKRINLLQQRILATEIETEKQMVILVEQIKRKDRVLQNLNDKIIAEVAASKALQQAIDRVKDNLYKYKNQIGGLDRLILEGVEFPDVGNYHIRPEILARDNMKYSRNRWVSEYKNHLLILFRELERLHLSSEEVTQSILQRIIEGFIMGLEGSRITQIYKNSTLVLRQMKDKFAVVSALIQSSIYKLKSQYPNLIIELDTQLVDTISRNNIAISRIQNGIVFLDRVQQILIEVPIIEQRNIMMAPTEVVDIHLSSELHNDVDRLKNTAFHLRVLIRALLDELQKVKQRTGYPLQIDERVIAMINQQAGGIIDVEDVLRVFQVRLPEQQIIIESQPERIVEVPQVVIVDKVVQKIVEVERIKEVQKIVNVPIQVPHVVQNIIQKIIPVERIVERIVEVPVQKQKVIQVMVEVPKIVEVERIVEQIVEVDKIIEVERQINHIIPQAQQIEVVVEKIVPIETIVEKIVEVPTIIQKIVEKIIRVPEIIQIQVIVEKVVTQIQYVIQPELVPQIQVQHKIVERVIQKPVPVVQIQERIVEVPQVIQKIIEIRTIQQNIVEVQAIREKLVIQDRIKEVEVLIQKVVPLITQVEKLVQYRVQVPVIVEKIVIVPEIVTQPFIERVIQNIIQEVQVNNPIIIKQPQVIEVEKIINHYVEVPNVVKTYEDKIVEVPVYVDRIKQVRVVVDKIVEKLVQVPKVVEIQKIVEKVVVVPRVIEKIVEVPQITEIPIDRIIIQEVIKEVERIVEIPIIQESIRELEVINNIFIPVEKVVQKTVQKLIECPIYAQKVITNNVIQEKVVEVIRQIPREIEVQRIVPHFIEKQKIVQIEKNHIIPIEVPIPTEMIIQKVVPIYEMKEQLVQVPQIVERIVEVKVEDVHVHEIQSVTHDIVVDRQIVNVPQYRVIKEKQIIQMPTIVEKIVPVSHVVDNIVLTQHLIQKVVQTTIEIPKVYQIEKVIEKIISVPQVMEIETPIPQIVRVNQVVTEVVQKIVPIQTVVEQIKQVQVEKEKIVSFNTIQQQVIQVDRYVEKPVIVQKLKQIVRDVNHIQKQLQIVERLQSVVVPIVSRQQIIVEVPHVLQKVVQRIVVMPQVKETIKYVHEIAEVENLGASVSLDVSSRQAQYKVLVGNIRDNINIIIQQLRRIMISQPHLQGNIQMLLVFLSELDKLNRFSRIVQVPVQKIIQKPVEVTKLVELPVKDQKSLRVEIALSMLTQKLILELMRIKKIYPDLQYQLQDDIKLLFPHELQSIPNNLDADFQSKLIQFQNIVTQRFQSLGNWTQDHQIMINSFLQQRFVLANILKSTNLEMQKIKMIGQKRLEGLRRYKTLKANYDVTINELVQLLPQLQQIMRNTPNSSQLIARIQGIINKLFEVQKTGGFVSSEPVRLLEDLKITDERVLSLLREREYEIYALRQKLTSFQKHKFTSSMDANIQTINHLNRQIQILKSDNGNLRNQLQFYSINSPEAKIRSLNQQILLLEQDRADLQNQLFNLRNQLSTQTNFANAQIQQYKIRLLNSGVTTVAEISPRAYQPSVTNSFHSQTHVSSLSPKNVTDSLAFSRSPHSSNPTPMVPSIRPTYSMDFSNNIPQKFNNGNSYQHYSSYSAKNKVFSPDSIPEIPYSSITNSQFQLPREAVNNQIQNQILQHGSEDTKSLSVPGVNYDIPHFQFNNIVPTAMPIVKTSSFDFSRNQQSIEANSYSQQQFPLTTSQQQNILIRQNQTLAIEQKPILNQSGIEQQQIKDLSPNYSLQHSDQAFQENQSSDKDNRYPVPLPLVTQNQHMGFLPPTTSVESFQNIDPIIYNIVQSNINQTSQSPSQLIPQTTNEAVMYQNVLQDPIQNISISSSQKVDYQKLDGQKLQPLNHQKQKQQILQNSLHSNLSVNSEHLNSVPVEKGASQISGESKSQLRSSQIQRNNVGQKVLQNVQQEGQGLAESHSAPVMNHNYSQQNLPWPESPNYDGLQQLSSNRGSQYSGYSGYSQGTFNR